MYRLSSHLLLFSKTNLRAHSHALKIFCDLKICLSSKRVIPIDKGRRTH